MIRGEKAAGDKPVTTHMPQGETVSEAWAAPVTQEQTGASIASRNQLAPAILSSSSSQSTGEMRQAGKLARPLQFFFAK